MGQKHRGALSSEAERAGRLKVNCSPDAYPYSEVFWFYAFFWKQSHVVYAVSPKRVYCNFDKYTLFYVSSDTHVVLRHSLRGLCYPSYQHILSDMLYRAC